MKIAHRTPDLLILTDLGAPIRITGGVCLVIGSAFLFAGIRSTTPVIAPYVIGVLLELAGFAMIVLPTRLTAAFDRGTHTLVITRRSLRGVTRDEVDFAKIAGVEAEQSAAISQEDRRPSGMWRVTIVLQSGARLPLTSYYSNSPTHAAAAAAARAFLSLPDPPPSPRLVAHRDPQTAVPLTIRDKATGGCVLVFIFLFLGVFVAIGGRLAYTQHERLTTYRPVRAVVLFVSVKEHRSEDGKGGSTYSPEISYRYTVQDREYVGTHVTPINESRSGQWAYKIVARYPLGDSTTAYYDPARPDQSYLLHEASPLPYIFVVFPLAIVALMAFGGYWKRRKAARASLPAAPSPTR